MIMLCVLDGWGLREGKEGNALKIAKLPNFQSLWQQYPHTELQASGEHVGLPQGQIGNSEVGHLNLGAGRVVYQELTRLFKAIEDGTFQQNPTLLNAMQAAITNDKALHLMGLLSDGGVHSHIEHLFALLDMAVKQGVEKIYVHAFLDGRDVPPSNAIEYIQATEKKLKELGRGQIATVCGRYYAMDRDKRWERIELAYKAMVHGEGEFATLAQSAVDASYHMRVTDEFVVPTVLVDHQGKPKGLIQDGDAVIFFNFRADRARQLTRTLIDEEFTGFERGKKPKVQMVCLTQYDVTIDAPVAFMPQNLDMTLGEVVSEAGLRQLRIAETEKYAHVTFFFNGGVEEPFPQEERILIPSPKVATYNLTPEMSAEQLTEILLKKLDTDNFDVIVVNFANPDMVGHTGYLEAAIAAVEKVDQCLGRIVDAVLEKGGIAAITADHGNVEMMIDAENDGPHTAHSTNPVPFILVGNGLKKTKLREGGSLQDVAPTLLELLKLDKPSLMTGVSLILDREDI